MAAPVYLSTTASSETGYVTAHDVALPTTAAGNHLVLVSGFDGSGGSISYPDGDTDWVEVLAVDLNANQKWRVWLRECDGTEDGSVTITTSAANQSSHRVLRYTSVRAGVAEGTTWDIAELGATGYGTTIDPPAVTTTWGATDNSFIVLLWAGGNSPTVSDYPDGYSNTGATTARVTIATGTKASSSTSDNPNTFTISASNNYRAATLVLRGAADVTAGAIGAGGTGAAHNATTLPPNTRAQAQVATGTGEGYPARIRTAQVASDIVIEWDLDNDGDYDETVEDITGHVVSGWMRRGRDYPSQVNGRSRPGQLQLVLDNTGNRFSYYNTASPLATAPFSLKTGRRIRVRASEATLDDPVVLARDRFATNGALTVDELGNAWSAPAGFTGLTVLAKVAAADGAPSGSGALFGEHIDINTTTYYAQCVVPYKDASNRTGILFHHTDASNYGALYQGDGTLYLVEVKAGVATTLDSIGTENRDDMAIGLAVNGTTLIGYVDGVEQVSATTTLTPTDKVGLYGRWYYQRAPRWSEFVVWNRALRTQAWDTTPAGILGTFRVTKVLPTVDREGRKTATLTALGDLGLLDRPIEPPASTGPDDVQSAGSKPGHLIGNALAKVGALHPPGPIDGGDLTLGAVGLDRQQAIAVVRRMEATEAGFLYELPEGGIGFERRSGRTGTSVVGTFTDDTTVAGWKIERFQLRDWQGDVINDVTSEVSGRLARYDIVTSNNNFTGFGVANDVTFDLPDAGDGATAGDLFVVAIAKTVWTAGVRWITPPGWTALRDPGDEKGKMAVFAKRATTADLGDSVTFYDDTGPAGGSWTAIVFIVHNWLGSIAAGVAVTEAVGYGPDTLTEAQAGTVDYPVVFTPWGARPTLFVALRTGMHTTSAAAVVSSASDDQAPDGFDSMGSVHINPSGFGQEVLHAAIQWARRIRTEAVLNPNSMGGNFTGFSHTEGLVVMVRGGFDNGVPTAGGGLAVHDANAADQEDRSAVLAHPEPGLHFEDETAAHAYNDLMLTRFGVDRPIVSLGFTATTDARHRDLAKTLDLSQRFRVDADGRIGEGIDAEFFVETITHSFSNGVRVWAVDVDLSPATDAGGGAD